MYPFGLVLEEAVAIEAAFSDDGFNPTAVKHVNIIKLFTGN